jgi:PAS domain S-box-containing protein
VQNKLEHSRRIGEALGPLFDGARLPIIALRRDGGFVAANRFALRQYGYSLEEILQRRIHDLIVGAHDVEADFDLVDRGIDGLKRREHRRKDGSHLWVLPAATPMMLCGERHIVSVPQDVTAIVAAEVRAKEDEERAEALWYAASEQLRDAIALLDSSYRIVKVNSAMREILKRCALAEKRPWTADVLGRPCREVFPLCRERPCIHEIAATENRRIVREFQGVSGRPIRVEVAPCDDTKAASSGSFALVHVGHDQGEELAFQSELVRADRLATIGRLAAGVAHEVNNPAALVTVNLGFLRDRLAAGAARPADMLAILDESLEGMRRIHEMVRDLKGFARERARERVDLAEVVSTAIRMAAHATRGHARVQKDLEAGVYANVRGARIAQVVLNLLINAAQAISAGRPADNVISVRTFRQGKLACIEVADSGPGVPEEIAGRIFEPFFTTREKGGGTGLGLWLAREIVQEEGGSLVLCETERRGATFLVSLAASAPELLTTDSGAVRGSPVESDGALPG